jgi:Zn-dependent peptidase ImmA (M78 family)
MLSDELMFKAKVVELILMKETGEAVNSLSKRYGVDVPHLKVGMPKKYVKKVGCYVSRTKTIHVRNREKLEDPFVVLHEFYHHLRTRDRKHRGTEKHADRFAAEFVEAFQAFHKQSLQEREGSQDGCCA